MTNTSTLANTQHTITRDGTRGRRVGHVVGRVAAFALRLGLAAFFANTGIMKLTRNPQVAAGFTELGGDPMMIFVGLLEIAGAIGLLVPILSGFAAIGLTVLLAIITVVTAVMHGPSMIALPVSCLIVAAALVVLRWNQTVRLAHFLRGIIRR